MIVSAYVLIIIALISGLVIRSILAYYKQLPSIKPAVRLIGRIVLLLSVWLTISSADELNRHAHMKNYPTVQGVITTSYLGGERAFHPVVNYNYFIDGKTHSGSEIIYTPGFGGKRKKREVAMKSLALYPPGDSITVYFNQKNHTESYLQVNANWDSYAKLGMGLFLIVISIIFTTLPKKRN